MTTAPTLAELLTRLCEAAGGAHGEGCTYAVSESGACDCEKLASWAKLGTIGLRDLETARTLAAALVALEEDGHTASLTEQRCGAGQDMAFETSSWPLRSDCAGCNALRDAEALRARMGECEVSACRCQGGDEHEPYCELAPFDAFKTSRRY